MRTPIEAAIQLIRQHHPYAWAWAAEDLRNWAAWYAKQDLMLCVTEDGHEIAGLVMLRTVMKANEWIGNTLDYDPEGSVVFVDFLYAPSDPILRSLICYAIKRIGRRDYIAWNRRGVFRCYPASRFVLHTLRKETV